MWGSVYVPFLIVCDFEWVSEKMTSVVPNILFTSALMVYLRILHVIFIYSQRFTSVRSQVQIKAPFDCTEMSNSLMAQFSEELGEGNASTKFLFITYSFLF